MTMSLQPEKSSSPAIEPGAQTQPGAATGIRVILADSQSIYRVGIKKVFALEDDIRAVSYTHL